MRLLEDIDEDVALNSFLSEFSSDINSENLSDEVIVKRFVSYGNQKDTLKAGRKFLSLSDQNWEWVSIILNRRFANNDEKRMWLESMLNLLEQELDKKDKEIRKQSSL